jgi:thiamine biosynthesis lipoprotein
MTAAPHTVAASESPAQEVLRWDALGSYVYLTVDDPAGLAQAGDIARQVLHLVDRTCSRFRADSDLTRVNARAGEWVAVDPVLVAAASVALEAAELTEGLVDPCLGRPMVALGYDQTMRSVRARDPRTLPVPLRIDHRAQAWREVRLDPEGALRVPADCALDLGATGKAWASDLVAATVADRLGCRVVVSLGGDVRIDGRAGPAWPVRVTERPDDADAELVLLAGGGLATSSTRARRWRTGGTGGTEQHHLLDPRTGAPVAGPWRTVTATGPTCVAANVATTAALVLAHDALGWLDRHAVTARLVATDGTVTTTGDWPDPHLDTDRTS